MEANLTVYEGTPDIMMLKTEETPKQILDADFPKHQWPVSGGWGYTQDDAVVIECDETGEGVALEYKFMEYRSYEETVILMSEGSQLHGLRFESLGQRLVCKEDGKRYDHVRMKVSGFLEPDFLELRMDWIVHHAYENDEEGKKAHLALADSKRISYETECWFDITRFFGKMRDV